MNQPIDCDNHEYFDVFENACKTGDFRELDQLISEQKFDINKPVYFLGLEDRPMVPLLEQAIRTCAKDKVLHVVTCLLEREADPNPKDASPLRTAISVNYLEVVQLLLDKGAEISLMPLWAIIKMRKPGESSGMFELVASRACQLVENPGAHEKSVEVGKYARLVHAMINNDAARVTELLSAGDYYNYSRVIYNYCHQSDLFPSCLIYNNESIGLGVVEAFARSGYDLDIIYFNSIKRGDVLKIIAICALNPDFDPNMRGVHMNNILHCACQSYDLDVIKHLVNNYRVNLEAKNNRGHTPVFNIGFGADLYSLLAVFPEIDLNVKDKCGKRTMKDVPDAPRDNCRRNAALLEFGADPGEYTHYDCVHQKDKNYQQCNVLQYLHKMRLIDPKYVQKILHIIDEKKMSKEKLESFLKTPVKEWEKEIKKMKSIRISEAILGRESMMKVRAKSLFDFIFFDANEAAKFSINEVVLNLYHENEQDFRKLFPHYGFALNRKLQRGIVRGDRFKSGMKLLTSGCGSKKLMKKLPTDFAELMFCHFSNRQLKSLLEDVI